MGIAAGGLVLATHGFRNDYVDKTTNAEGLNPNFIMMYVGLFIAFLALMWMGYVLARGQDMKRNSVIIMVVGSGAVGVLTFAGFAVTANGGFNGKMIDILIDNSTHGNAFLWSAVGLAIILIALWKYNSLDDEGKKNGFGSVITVVGVASVLLSSCVSTSAITKLANGKSFDYPGLDFVMIYLFSIVGLACVMYSLLGGFHQNNEAGDLNRRGIIGMGIGALTGALFATGVLVMQLDLVAPEPNTMNLGTMPTEYLFFILAGAGMLTMIVMATLRLVKLCAHPNNDHKDADMAKALHYIM